MFVCVSSRSQMQTNQFAPSAILLSLHLTMDARQLPVNINNSHLDVCFSTHFRYLTCKSCGSSLEDAHEMAQKVVAFMMLLLLYLMLKD